VRSDQCRVDDLFVALQMPDSVRQRLVVTGARDRIAVPWTASWRFQGDETSCAAQDLAAMPIQSSEPVAVDDPEIHGRRQILAAVAHPSREHVFM
jgi:hypothetical protein